MRMKQKKSVFAGVLVALLAAAPSAHAQLGFAEASAMLSSSDADELGFAIEALAGHGARAVEPLAARIRAGLPDPVLVTAVGALGRLARREAGPTLVLLTRHRTPTVRVAAIDALTLARHPDGERACVVALSDAEPSVRSAAALALGALGARGAADALFRALDRNVIEAAHALGQLANEQQIERLFGYVGRLELESMTPALQEVFARRDIPSRLKVRLIGQMEELATVGIRNYLETLAESLPSGDVREAATEAAQRIVQ